MSIKKPFIVVLAFMLMGFSFDQKDHKIEEAKEGYITYKLKGEKKSIQAGAQFYETKSGKPNKINIYAVDEENYIDVSFGIPIDKGQEKTFDVSHNPYNTDNPKKILTLSYSASNGISYMNNKNSEGQIEVTKNNGNYISGNFDMTLFNQRGNKQLHLKNGTFTKLKIK